MLYSYQIFKCFARSNQKFGKSLQEVFDCLSIVRREYSTAKWKVKAPVEPKTMKLETPEFKACITEDVIMLENWFSNNGHEIRMVGGAVRDLLLGIQPKDLDFATTATPTEMKEMFIEKNVRLINDNGEKHGTITPRINDKNFEITTLRIDVVTYGRRAEVQFTKDWYLDANRRDLTVNSMYLGFDGTLYDYFNGYEDLKNRRVRFVGNTADRIQEDYLRILRYFRFYGRIAKHPNNHDEEALQAIRENAKGLKGVSGERIWMELNKLLMGNFAFDLLQKMIELGIGPYIGFPEKCNLEELSRVRDNLERNEFKVNPITLLCSIFENEEDLTQFYLRIKPSCYDRDLGYFIVNSRNGNQHSKPIRAYQLFLLNSKISNSVARQYVSEFLKYKGKAQLLKEWENWVIPKFPIGGKVLQEKGVSGRQLGLVLNKLKEIWVEHDFDISSDKLIEQIPDIISSLPPATKREKQNNKNA